MSVLDWQNPLPQTVHLNGFSFECTYLNGKFKIEKLVYEKLVKIINLPMVSEMVLTAECFAANIARIWPFVRVGSLVYEQII
jgi:hypothetical protein